MTIQEEQDLTQTTSAIRSYFTHCKGRGLLDEINVKDTLGEAAPYCRVYTPAVDSRALDAWRTRQMGRTVRGKPEDVERAIGVSERVWSSPAWDGVARDVVEALLS